MKRWGVEARGANEQLPNCYTLCLILRVLQIPSGSFLTLAQWKHVKNDLRAESHRKAIGTEREA